jgi:hypothetical protein
LVNSRAIILLKLSSPYFNILQGFPDPIF